MTVAIISEYNPFHQGHLHQINEIRKAFGEETSIIAIMSGNYTQRGEIAIADKYLRAEWAVLCGVDLVLELPFPYSSASAEIFAQAAVKIIKSIGIVDILSFGSESGDIYLLDKIAQNMLSKDYNNTFKSISSEAKELGYPALCEMAYRMAFGDDLSDSFFSPNNILAVEYIKAVKSECADIALHTIKREGAEYNTLNIVNHNNQSAMAIRELLKADASSAVFYVPHLMKTSFINALSSNEFPTDVNKLSSLFISHFVLNSSDNEDIFDVGGGLYYRLKNASLEASDIASLISGAETKKFTNARIKRGLWYSLFGVTSSKIKELPKFTQVLAMDMRGRSLLKSIKERGDFPILTKPSAYSGLNNIAVEQKRLLDRADAIFQLTKPNCAVPSDALRKTPFVKNSK